MLSLDMFAQLLETVVNTKTLEHDTASIVHATAISNWAEYVSRVPGGRVPYPGWAAWLGEQYGPQYGRAK
eukprot:7257388-Pyramimonas_sp.AAC.1